MKANNLDALLFPGASGAAIAAKPGYPDGNCAFRYGPQRRGAAVSSGIRCQAIAFWSGIYQYGLH